MNHWLFITRPEFWEQLKPPNNIWIYRKAYDKVNIGDRAVILVSRMTVFVGVVEVRSNFRRRGALSAFPYLTDIQNIKTLKEENYIPVVKHREYIELFKGKSNKGWGATLQNSIMSLKENDFQYIYNKIIENS